ncbi:thiosulfate:glutathione sulfurtransferase-like [Stigmatopora nigra]
MFCLNTRKTVQSALHSLCSTAKIHNSVTYSAIMDISYDDLKALLEKQNQNLYLIDVRTQQEVDKGRIPGSLHIPVEGVEEALGLSPEAFKAKYGVNKPPLNSDELVFHCQMGRRAATATSKAKELGFAHARNYVGGYQEWSEKGGK